MGHLTITLGIMPHEAFKFTRHIYGKVQPWSRARDKEDVTTIVSPHGGCTIILAS